MNCSILGEESYIIEVTQKIPIWNSIIWNNKEIRVNGSPIYYKNYFEFDLFNVSDLLFNLNNSRFMLSPK